MTPQFIITGATSFAVGLLGKIVFDWLKHTRCNSHSNRDNGKISEVKEDVKWLKELHDKRDVEGLPLCYVPREWKKTLDTVSERTFETNIHLKEIKDILRKISEK